MKNRKNKLSYFYKSIQAIICFCLIFVSFKTWATPKSSRDSIASDSIIIDDVSKKYKIELVTVDFNNSGKSAFSLPPNFSYGNGVCNNNGTPCDPADDIMCVNVTFNEVGLHLIGFKNCTPDTYINQWTQNVTYVGQTVSFCLSRNTALGASCTYNSLPAVLLWVGREFGDYSRLDVFPTIPASCSSGSSASPPSVTNNTGCAGASVSLFASCSSGTALWYTSSSGGSAFHSGSTYTNSYSAGSYTYYVACGDGSGCESSRTAVTATINAQPSAPNGTGASRCGTGSVTLNASCGGGGSVNWYSASSGGSYLGAGNSFPTPSISSTTTYYAECSTGSCVSSRTGVTATINTLPSAPSGTGGSRCGTGSVSLSASCGSGSVYWYDASSGGTQVGSSGFFSTPSISSTTTYYAECNTGICASSRTGVTATINNLPSAPSTTSASGCITSSIALSANCGSGTPQWYSASSGGSLITTGTGYNTTYASTTTHYVSCKDGATNCESSRTPVTATVENLPTVASAGADKVNCNNSTFTMTGNTPSIGTGAWSVVSGSASVSSPSSPSSSVTGVAPGTSATLRWTITNASCPVSTDDVVLTNDALPTAASAGADKVNCNNGTFTMTGNSPSIGTGVWSVVSGSASVSSPSSSSSSVTSVASGTSATLRWTISNASCPSSTDDVVLTNDALPTVASAGADKVNCNNGTFTMTGNSPSIGTGAWSVVSGSASVGSPSSSSSSVTGVPAGTTATLRWTITNATCPVSTDDVVLTNDALPTVAAAGADKVNCNNSNFTMTGNTPSIGAGVWSVVSGTATIGSSSNATTSISGVPAGTSATLRWTITNATCPVSTDDVVLTNDALPTVATAGADKVNCNNGTFTMTGNTPIIGTGVWSIVSGSASISSPSSSSSSVTSVVPGTTVTLRWTITNATCPVSTDDVVLTNDALPTVASAGADKVNCNNGTFNMTVNSAIIGTGLWTVISGTATISSASSALSSITGIPAGTSATLRWTISNATCPVSTDDVVLTNDALPTVASAGADKVNCNNSDFTMTGNTPSIGTGLWSVISGSATIASTSSATTSISGVPAGTTATLRWTISNATCPVSTDDVVLTNDALPTVASAGADKVNCNNSVFAMTANTPIIGTGLWSIVSGSASISSPSSSSSSVTSVAPGTTVTLRWTITNASCPVSADDVVLTNDALPTVANAGVDKVNCNNGTFTMTGNTPIIGTGLWSVVSGTASISSFSSPTSSISGVPAGTTATLRWTISNASCSSTADDVVLTNDALPTVSAAGADKVNCNNSNFTMTGNTPSIGTGAWSVVSGTATIVSPSSATSSISGVPAGTTATLRWTITNATCPVSTDDVVLTNDALPTVAAAGSDKVNCDNGTFTMTGNTPSIGTGLWSVISGSATIASPSSATTSISGVPAGTTATLRWTITNASCPVSTDDVVLTNDALPTVAAAGADKVNCNNSNFTMTGNTPSIGTGLWSVISGVATIGAPASATSSVISVAAGTTATLRWTITNATCPVSTDDVILTNDALPTVANAGIDKLNCDVATFTMTANTPSIGTGLWSVVSGTGTITTPSSPTTTITGVPTASVITLRWTISNASCPPSMDDVVLTNDALPPAAISGINIICYGESTTLTASGGVSYAWNFGSTNPVVTLSPTVTTTYTVTVTNSNGCTKTTSYLVTVRTLVVTNTNDTGEGTLRQAILCANMRILPEVITFNIPTSDPNYINPDGIPNNGDEYWNISVAIADLPTVTDELIIDGLTQASTDCNFIYAAGGAYLLSTFSNGSGKKPKGVKLVANGGGLGTQRIIINSSANLLTIKGVSFVNWVNQTTDGLGNVKLNPLSGASRIIIDCSFMNSKL